MLPATKELHRFFKADFHPKDDLEKAGRWFYLNRTSYSGIMNFQNMYFGYGDKFSMQPKNWPRNILRTSEKLQKVKLTSLDFEKVIDKAPDNSLVFLDPPYFNASMGHYNPYNEQDFENLLKLLSTIKGKFLLSSYPSPLLHQYIRKHKWKVKEIEMPLSVTAKYNSGKRKTEVLTANYPI